MQTKTTQSSAKASHKTSSKNSPRTRAKIHSSKRSGVAKHLVVKKSKQSHNPLKHELLRPTTLLHKVHAIMALALSLITIVAGIWGIIIGNVSAAPATGTGYTLTSQLGNCLDNRGGSTANGNTVWLYTCNKTIAQEWTISGDGTIRNQGHCLDVKYSGVTPGTIVWLYNCNGTGAQQWQSTANGTVINPQSKLCLDVRDGMTASGVQAQVYTCNSTPAQTWTLAKTATSVPTPVPSPTPTPTPTPVPPSTGSATPKGPGGSWALKFSDEFSGSVVDYKKWDWRSTAEANWYTKAANGRDGTSNPGNQQLEFDQPSNCSVANGVLSLNAKPDSVTIGGKTYKWSSCLLTTTNSYKFKYGYIEVSAKFPAAKGFWPAFWTWQDKSNNISGSGETDGFEYYSDNKTNLYLTQHQGKGGECTYAMKFNPTTEFHSYGVDVEPTGTTWYVDGVKACSVTGTTSGLTNIILDNFVYSQIAPAAGSTGSVHFDYVRAWQK